MRWPRNFELQGVALKHSPLQLMFSVLGYKTEYEQRHGPIKSEVLAKRYEDSITWANPEEAATWLQTFANLFVGKCCTSSRNMFFYCLDPNDALRYLRPSWTQHALWETVPLVCSIV